jgi:hypothetical protein
MMNGMTPGRVAVAVASVAALVLTSCAWAQSTCERRASACSHVADAYPDSNTGQNTAVSSALLTKFVQVFILPDAQSKLVTFEPKHYLAPYKGTPFPRPPAEEARETGVPVSIAKAASN